MNFRNTDVFILAGGRGSRIKDLTNRIPKPLIKFNNKPVLSLIINHISKYNFKKIFILAGYKGAQIYKKYHNKYYNFIKINCIIEKKRCGTWGDIYKIRNKIKRNFVLINGDTIFNADLENFLRFSLKKEDMVMLISNNHSYKENKKLINIKINRENNIIFNKNSPFINSGYYYISKKIFKKKTSKKKSLENDIIPELIKEKRIKGFIENKKIVDIGTKINLIHARREIPRITTKPAVFLDRDGVINYDYGHIFKFKDFKFKPGIIKTLRFLSKKKIYIFIVTNQAGIAKGLYTKKDFYILHRRIKKYLVNKKIFINDVKFCPFHPQATIKKYKKISKYRKPGNLMIEKIFLEWDIIRNKSFMIGDSISDELAAKKSKLYFEYPKKKIYDQIKKICVKLKI
jgi:D-glycero-D-manno-heptose 1,7-bisphosphate phosphatase